MINLGFIIVTSQGGNRSLISALFVYLMIGHRPIPLKEFNLKMSVATSLFGSMLRAQDSLVCFQTD